MATSMFVLNCSSRSFGSVTGAVANALELHAVALLERPRERDDVVRVHLEAERDGSG